jgi:glutathione S-transferase
MEGCIALKHHTAPVAAIATIRATTGDKFFAPETQTAIAASSATHSYFGLINKHIALTPPSSWRTTAALAPILAGRLNTDASILFASILKLHHAVNFGKEGVIASYPHIDAWLKRRAALPHQDAAGSHRLARKPFDT